MRQVMLDVETTGLSTADGHRIIELGCVELLDRRLTGRVLHEYINPQREIEQEAAAVHGITLDFLRDKPLFKELAPQIIDFLEGAQLVIHNAAFDIGFLNYEFRLAGQRYKCVEEYCTVLDTLALARKAHPGKQNSLDALCRRYRISNTHRHFHGALLDAQLLAQVYLQMTGGQAQLFTDEGLSSSILVTELDRAHDAKPFYQQAAEFVVIYANDEELRAHAALCESLSN